MPQPKNPKRLSSPPPSFYKQDVCVQEEWQNQATVEGTSSQSDPTGAVLAACRQNLGVVIYLLPRKSFVKGPCRASPGLHSFSANLLLLLKVQVPLLVPLLTLDGSVGNALSKRWASLFVVESCGQTEQQEQVPGSFLLPTDLCSEERMSPYAWHLHRGSCIITKCSLSLFGAHQLASCNSMKVT